MCENPNQLKSLVFECDVCGRTFGRKCSLTEHKYIHSDSKPFECEICGKKFRQNSNFSKHEKLHQKIDSKYSCDLCGKTFAIHSYLKSHLLSHNQVKNCLCDKCGHTFKHKSDLSRHLKIHDNQRQYKCDVCLFGFNDRSALKRHKNRSHPTINKPICDQSSHQLHQSDQQLTSSPTKTIINVDLNDSDYFNSTVEYINICRILPVPLPNHIFEKLVELQKQIGLHLGLENRCQTGEEFTVLRTALNDLNGVIWEHLHFKYKILN